MCYMKNKYLHKHRVMYIFKNFALLWDLDISYTDMNCAYPLQLMDMFLKFKQFYQTSSLFHAPTNIFNKFSLESSGPVMKRCISEDSKVVARSFLMFQQLFVEIFLKAENRKGNQLPETFLFKKNLDFNYW